jgi:uncharacterized protein
MFGRFRVSAWLICLLLLGLVEAGSFVGAAIVVATPAHAQYWGGRPSGGGFFSGWFGGGGGYNPPPQREYRQYRKYREYREYESPAESAHAPPPRKAETKLEPNQPTTNVVVMGDGMADWLAYGLEDAFADTPEVSILRKPKTFSGLLRYDPKSDLDWWHVARDLLAQEKPSYVVMMLGVSDRQNIRERDLQKEAEKEAKEKQAKEQKAKEQKEKDQAKDAKEPKDAAKEQKDAKEQKPQPAEQPQKPAEAENVDSEAPPADQQKAAEKPKRNPNGIVEFRSEQWEKIYIKRIDETIAALKSKNVPVFWVGLPAIRGAKSTADASYLNNLYRTRAQRAGIIFIDVWDGFVDEDGKYAGYGPDYEGQQRRLRSNDGVYFTKYGARKLAHYVEREIRRYMASHVVSLPSQTVTPAPGSAKPTERPVAGPIIPLALVPSNADETLAGSNTRPQGDPLALQVLVKGEPVNPQPGRADDFSWPIANDQRPTAAEPAKAPANANAKAAPVAPAQAPAAVTPNAAPASSSEAQPAGGANAPAALATEEPTDRKAVQQAPARPKAKPKPAHSDVPRPPRDIGQQRGGLFGGLFR